MANALMIRIHDKRLIEQVALASAAMSDVLVAADGDGRFGSTSEDPRSVQENAAVRPGRLLATQKWAAQVLAPMMAREFIDADHHADYSDDHDANNDDDNNDANHEL